MYYTRPRYFTLRTSWIYRPRTSSPIFGVALRIILAQNCYLDNVALGPSNGMYMLLQTVHT